MVKLCTKVLLWACLPIWGPGLYRKRFFMATNLRARRTYFSYTGALGYEMKLLSYLVAQTKIRASIPTYYKNPNPKKPTLPPHATYVALSLFGRYGFWSKSTEKKRGRIRRRSRNYSSIAHFQRHKTLLLWLLQYLQIKEISHIFPYPIPTQGIQ